MKHIQLDGQKWDETRDLDMEPEIVHVYPLFGRAHEVSLECWCKPVPCEPFVFVHNVEH